MKRPSPEATQTLPSSHHEVQEWFVDRTQEANLKQLKQSDLEMIRVLDDLIHLLLENRVIGVNDLPSTVQAKLQARNRARKNLPGMKLLAEQDSGLI